MKSKKIFVLQLLLCSALSVGLAQKYQSIIGFGVKSYLFNDWGARVIKPSALAINYRRTLKKDIQIGVDFDIFNARVVPSYKYPRQEFLNSAYYRYYTSGGVSVGKEVLKKFYLNAGARLRYGREEHLGNSNFDITYYDGYTLGFQLGLNYNLQLSKHILLQPELGYQYFTRFTKSQYYIGIHLGYMFEPVKKNKKKSK